MKSLATPASVQMLRIALHAKAKEASGFRFYALYDKVYREDVLAFAYQCCRANGGAAGVDDQSFEDIEAYGVDPWTPDRSSSRAQRLTDWRCTPTRRATSDWLNPWRNNRAASIRRRSRQRSPAAHPLDLPCTIH